MLTSLEMQSSLGRKGVLILSINSDLSVAFYYSVSMLSFWIRIVFLYRCLKTFRRMVVFSPYNAVYVLVV